MKGRQVYDARGRLSVEAEVYCVVHNKEKVKVSLWPLTGELRAFLRALTVAECYMDEFGERAKGLKNMFFISAGAGFVWL